MNSKGLEALGKIHDHWNCCNPNSNGCDEEDFKVIEKGLKALEIIKKHLRIAKPFDLETKEEEQFEIFDLDLWNDGKQKKEFEFVRKVLEL